MNSTLQQRVHEYLSDKPEQGLEEVPTASAIKDMQDLLETAENELRTMQTRVDRIRRDLAKLQS